MKSVLLLRFSDKLKNDQIKYFLENLRELDNSKHFLILSVVDKTINSDKGMEVEVHNVNEVEQKSLNDFINYLKENFDNAEVNVIN